MEYQSPFADIEFPNIQARTGLDPFGDIPLPPVRGGMSEGFDPFGDISEPTITTPEQKEAVSGGFDPFGDISMPQVQTPAQPLEYPALTPPRPQKDIKGALGIISEPSQPEIQPEPNRSALEKIRTAWQRGKESFRSEAELGRAVSGQMPEEATPELLNDPLSMLSSLGGAKMTPEDERKLQSLVERQAAIERVDEIDPLEGRNKLANWVYGASRMLGGMWESYTSAWDDALAGAGIGAAVTGGLAGILPGAGYGLTVGSAKEWYFQGVGQMYREMVKEGTDQNIAKNAALIGAVPYAATEFLFARMPGVKALMKMKPVGITRAITKGTLGNAIKGISTQIAKNYLIQSGGEITEEGIQQVIQDVTANVGNYLNNKGFNKSKEGRSARDIFVNGLDAMMQAAGPILVTGAPGVAYQGVQAASRFNQVKSNITSANQQFENLSNDFGAENVSRPSDNVIDVNLPNGKRIRMQFEKDLSATIDEDPQAFIDSVKAQGRAGRKAANKALIDANGDIAEAAHILNENEEWSQAGLIKPNATIEDENGNAVTVDALISLEEGWASRGTANHEIWHALKQIAGITAEEQAELDRMFGGSEEKEAYAFERYTDKVGALSRIKQAMDLLLSGNRAEQESQKEALSKIKQQAIARLKAQGAQKVDASNLTAEQKQEVDNAVQVGEAEKVSVDEGAGISEEMDGEIRVESPAEQEIQAQEEAQAQGEGVVPVASKAELNKLDRRSLFKIVDSLGISVKKGAEKSKVVDAIVQEQSRIAEETPIMPAETTIAPEMAQGTAEAEIKAPDAVEQQKTTPGVDEDDLTPDVISKAEAAIQDLTMSMHRAENGEYGLQLVFDGGKVVKGMNRGSVYPEGWNKKRVVRLQKALAYIKDGKPEKLTSQMKEAIFAASEYTGKQSVDAYYEQLEEGVKDALDTARAEGRIIEPDTEVEFYPSDASEYPAKGLVKDIVAPTNRREVQDGEITYLVENSVDGLIYKLSAEEFTILKEVKDDIGAGEEDTFMGGERQEVDSESSARPSDTTTERKSLTQEDWARQKGLTKTEQGEMFGKGAVGDRFVLQQEGAMDTERIAREKEQTEEAMRRRDQAQGKLFAPTQAQVSIESPVKDVSPEAEQAVEAQTIEEDNGTKRPASLLDVGQEVRVRSGYGNQSWEVVEVMPQNEAEAEFGEQFYNLRNKKTGEVAAFERSEIQDKPKTLKQMSRAELRAVAKRNGVPFKKGDDAKFLRESIIYHMRKQEEGNTKFSVRNLNAEGKTLVDYMANFKPDEMGIKQFAGTWGSVMRFFARWFLFGETRVLAGEKLYTEALERFFDIQTTTDRAMAQMNRAISAYAKKTGRKDLIGAKILEKGDEAITFALEEKGGRDKLNDRQKAIYDIIKSMINSNLDMLKQAGVLEQGWLEAHKARLEEQLKDKVQTAQSREQIQQEINEISDLQKKLDERSTALSENEARVIKQAIDARVKELNAAMNKDVKDQAEIKRLQNEINALETKFEGYVSHVMVYQAIVRKINNEKDFGKRIKAIKGLSAFYARREGVNTLREYTEKWTDSSGKEHDAVLEASDLNPVAIGIKMTADTLARIQMRKLIEVFKAEGLMIPAVQQYAKTPSGESMDTNEMSFKWIPVSQISGIDKRGIKEMKVHPVAAGILTELGQTDRKQRNPFDRALALVKTGQFAQPAIIWTYNPIQAIIGGVPFHKFLLNHRQAMKEVVSRGELWQEMMAGGAAQNPGLPTESTKDQQIEAYVQRLSTDVSKVGKLVNFATQSKVKSFQDWAKEFKEKDGAGEKASMAVKSLGNAIVAPYQAIGNLTWFGDAVQRMATYMSLKEMYGNSKSNAEIARMTGDIHGAYGKTSEAYRRLGGRVFFVHTFRLLMPQRIYKGMTEFPSMIAGSLLGKRKWDSYTSAEKKQAALAFAGTVGLPIATYAMMTANGWEPDDEGLPEWWVKMKAKIPIGLPFPTLKNYWKFKKTVTLPDGTKKELVAGIGNIVNMPVKWIERSTKERPEKLDDLSYHIANLMKWELHPFYRIALDIVTNESSMGGQPPVDRSKPIYKQIADATTYAFGESFRIYNSMLGDSTDTAYRREVKNDLEKGLNAFEKVMLGYYAGYTKTGKLVPISYGYTYSRQERRKRLHSALSKISGTIAREKNKSKDLLSDRPEELRKRYIELNNLERRRKLRLKKIFLGMETQ